MTSNRLPLASTLLLLGVVACVPAAVRNAAPPISSIDKNAPDPNVLPIIPSEPIAVDSQKALENYQALLKLDPDADTKAEAQRRMADLQVQMADDAGNGPATEKSLKSAIKLYNDMLYANPTDKHNDRVFYQLARAYQNDGQTDAAIDSLAHLTHDYPDSDLAGDAHFRRAELLFLKHRYAEAEAEYKVVMDLGDKTPFFNNAQYKFGWSRFKQSNYEGALDVFIAILDRELPPGKLYRSEDALKSVARNKADLAQDSLRVVDLSLIALGGGKAADDYLARKGDPRFYPLIYSSLGDMLLDKRRYTDAAQTFADFIGRHPQDSLAPDFQSRVIAADLAGGFNDLVVKEKERYATTYDPAAPYWAGKPATAEVLGQLRIHMGDLAKYYQARGQQDKVKNQADFLTAAHWNQRLMEVFPKDPEIAEINFAIGDCLLEGGKTVEAAAAYAHTAYSYPGYPRASDAGYASVLAYEKYAQAVPPEQKSAALRQSIDASKKFAGAFPNNREVVRVLTRSAEELYELKAYDEAIGVAARVLNWPREVDYMLRRSAWTVTADSQFALQHYPQAEAAYSEELKLTPATLPNRPLIVEQLAASIYKQGEAARDKGDLRTAANQFLRVASVTPDAKIRPTAEYDASAALIKLSDWPAAITVLESFRSRYPDNALAADVDKKLAVAYQKDGKPLQAAQTFERISQRSSESPTTRTEAAWLSASLYDQAKDVAGAEKAYEQYVKAYPRPLDRAMLARSRLVEISKDRGDTQKQVYWLHEIVAADDGAGADRTDASHSLAAHSSLTLATLAAADVKQLHLTLPLDKSVARKKAAMEQAIQQLNKTMGYGYSDIDTAATYQLGDLYRDFGQSILDSERPKKLSGLELEQYNLLIEEQAEPFIDQAIKAHEVNLQRIQHNVYDDWVARSYTALVALAPGQYAKREKSENIYATLK
ncbi:MAG TPA: tetratricopeptide repeat protein [Stenotrophobium sp.]|nr:tetratricopeptide repeat protein [Stenotrophobium sp.]